MVDICLICEGTYPYITGGVSAWTHNLIKDFPNFTFGVVHISSKIDHFRQFKYALPPNVIEYIEIPIHEPIIDSDGLAEMKADAFDFYSFHQELKKGDHTRFAQILKRVSPDGFGGDEINSGAHGKITGEKILYSRESFDIITNLYRQCGLNTSFIDYYWTFRTTHLPLLQILNAPILKASIYHPVSTGYAGLYAVTAKLKTGSPLILTEHGIYTVERKIEVAEASWMLDEGGGSLKLQAQLGKIKDFWIKIFDFLSRLTYKYADELISLYSENKKMQVALGADEKRILLIPNGIDIEKFENLKGRMGGEDATLKVGFVGRVVPVKDVETFVKAAKLINDSIDNVEFFIIGPDDEDAEYAREIRNLVSALDMATAIKFTGLANTSDYYKV
ncbi:MAG TPA: GT4 family glycosyltransferase PelF, partial [Candidatus Wallbacteria bacterium]|nr:GT4 family glycosyltransferase PelF [Candidatus Wallbacteria bacterium]